MCNELKGISNKLFIILITAIFQYGYGSSPGSRDAVLQEEESLGQRLCLPKQDDSSYVESPTQDDDYSNSGSRLPKYGSPMYGTGFSYMMSKMGDKEKESLLTALIGYTVTRVEKTSFEVPAALLADGDKEHYHGRMDYYCEVSIADRSEMVLIELQVTDEDYFNHRALWYACGRYFEQRRKADKLSDIKRVIAVNLLDFARDGMPENKFKRHYMLMDVERFFDEDSSLDLIKRTVGVLKKNPETFSIHDEQKPEWLSSIDTLQIIQYEVPRMPEFSTGNNLLGWLTLFNRRITQTWSEIPSNLPVEVKTAAKIMETTDWEDQLKKSYTRESLKMEGHSIAMKKQREEGREEGAIRNALKTAFEQWNSPFMSEDFKKKTPEDKAKILITTELIAEEQKEKFGKLMDQGKTIGEILTVFGL